MAAFLKVRDAQVADLQKKLKASDERAATKQLIRDFDEKGVSGWHFAKDDIGFMCGYFVLPTSILGSIMNSYETTTGKLPGLKTFPG